MTAPSVRTRDQVVDALVAGRRNDWWHYLGNVAPGEYAVEIAGRRRQHDVGGMSGYLDGFGVGIELAGELREQGLAPTLAPESLHALLNAPSVPDQRRIRIAHAMEQRGWTYADIASRLHAQRSTVRGMLAYGRRPARVTRSSRNLSEIEKLLPELARGYGRRPAAIANPPRMVAGLSEAGRKEPIELRRARALALAVEAGLLSTWSPLDVTDLRSARVVRVVDVRHRAVLVRTTAVIPWAQGLADGTEHAAALIGWQVEAHAALSVLAQALT